MSDAIHILILEDNPADAELVQFELQEAGLVFTSKVVMTENEYVEAIRDHCPDLILSDYDLPKYTGALALAEAKERCPDTPFILVTGAVTEDRAIDILTQGAKDYVLKIRLEQRLVPAVKRALAEAEEHRARRQAEAELRKAHRTLEDRVKSRTAELQEQIETRKKTEEALRDSEERQRLVLQASSMGTFEVDLLTGEGQWNATEFELLGLKPGEVKASPDAFFRFVHPDDVEQLRNQWAEALRSGNLDAEFRIVRADGQERWLAGRGQFFSDGKPEGNDSGTSREPFRFMGVNFDITERKKAEEASATAQRQIQSLMDNSTALIYAFDLEERFLLVNTALARLLNSTPERMIGKRRHDFMPKQDADWHEANDRQTIEAGRALEFEEYSQLKGRSITWLTTKFPLRDAQGRIYAVAGITADVSERKRAEEALRESEGRYRALVAITKPVLYRVNSDWTELTEVSTDGFLAGSTWRRDWFGDYIHPDDMTAVMAAIQEAIHSKTPLEVEHRVRRADGSIGWTHSRAAPLLDPAGNIREWFGTDTDVTARKRAEEELTRTTMLLETLLTQAPIGFAYLDRELRFVLINDKLAALNGLPVAAHIGKPVGEIVPTLLPAVQEVIGKILATGQPVRDHEFSGQTALQPGVTRYWNQSWYPVRDDTGAIVGFGAVVEETTDRKRAEEALRESEARFRLALKNSPVLVTMQDTNLVYQWVFNTWTRRPEEVVGKTDADLFAPDEAVALSAAKSQVLETGREVRGAFWLTINGQRVFLDCYYEPVRDAAGKVIGVGGASVDLTEQKQAEEALKERTRQLDDANEELDGFTYSVSHDLRAPLRGIDGYARMILKQQGDKFDEKTRNQFDAITKNTEMMGQLIQDLLALSRLGREAISMSKLNIGDLARDVWEELNANNPDRPTDLKIDHVPPATGDRSFIKQVLVNILSNASKFTRIREVPVIEVGGYEGETENVYYVRDNGVGFDMQYLDKLFCVFQRLHSTDEYEGTGIGLALVQRIIHRHGGRVWAEGEVDKGATFYFTLPIS